MPKYKVRVVDAFRNPLYEITATSEGRAHRLAARRYQEEDYARWFFSTITEPRTNKHKAKSKRHA